MKTGNSIYLCLIFAASFLHCGFYKNPAYKLRENLFYSHHHLKDDDFEKLSPYFSAAKSEALFETLEEWKKNVVVEDFEIGKVVYDEKSETAKANISLTVRQQDSITMKQQNVEERWVYIGGRWFLEEVKFK